MKAEIKKIGIKVQSQINGESKRNDTYVEDIKIWNPGGMSIEQGKMLIKDEGIDDEDLHFLEISQKEIVKESSIKS